MRIADLVAEIKAHKGSIRVRARISDFGGFVYAKVAKADLLRELSDLDGSDPVSETMFPKIVNGTFYID